MLIGPPGLQCSAPKPWCLVDLCMWQWKPIKALLEWNLRADMQVLAAGAAGSSPGLSAGFEGNRQLARSLAPSHGRAPTAALWRRAPRRRAPCLDPAPRPRPASTSTSPAMAGEHGAAGGPPCWRAFRAAGISSHPCYIATAASFSGPSALLWSQGARGIRLPLAWRLLRTGFWPLSRAGTTLSRTGRTFLLAAAETLVLLSVWHGIRVVLGASWWKGGKWGLDMMEKMKKGRLSRSALLKRTRRREPLEARRIRLY